MKKAFTLAETMITIIVLGLIAALTIPSVSKVYQKRVMTTQLQKAYAQLTQAGTTVNAVEGISDFHSSKALKNGKFIGTYIPISGETNPKAIYQLGYRYVNDPDEKAYPFNGIDEGSTKCGILKSGATVCVDANGYGFIDVNGDKGPNLIGRDAYTIGFNNDGSVDSHYSDFLRKIRSADWDLDAATDNRSGGRKVEEATTTPKAKKATKKN